MCEPCGCIFLASSGFVLWAVNLWSMWVLHDWPPWTIADEVVTSSAAVVQDDRGQNKPVTHCALQGQNFPEQDFGQNTCTLNPKSLHNAAAAFPAKLLFFKFSFGGSPDNSGFPGGSVQIKVQNQSNKGLSIWSLSPAWINTWGDDIH